MQPTASTELSLPCATYSYPLLFNQKAIEIWADANCQNCLFGKDIMLKTTHLFIKPSYELYLTLWSFFCESQVLGWFSIEKLLEMWANTHCQSWLSDKDIMLKPLSLSSKAISNIMKLLSGSQVLGYFSIEKPQKYRWTPITRTASLADVLY